MELEFLSIAEASKLIANKKISPVELTDTLLNRAATLDPQVNSFITLTADIAKKTAKDAENEIVKGRYKGHLHGIPFGLKDIYNTKGILTSGGSAICENNVPVTDATTTTKLIAAGAILMGKLQTHEFAHGGPSFDLPWPPARNPWDLERFTGGSSSGSGAALAAGFIPAALGSDTGGSIRGPASFCGITGFMPTYGLVSRAGVIPNSFTFDHCGPMARSSEDCAILLQSIAGYDPADPGSIAQNIPDYLKNLNEPIKGMRIGILRHYWEEDVITHAEHTKALNEAVAVFKSLGAHTTDCRIRPVQEGFDIKVIIAESELFSIHQENLIKQPGKFGRDFLGRVLPACLFQSVDYVQAMREHRKYITEMSSVFEKFDLLLTSGFGPAPKFEDYRSENFWTKHNVLTPANTARTPALSLPCGFTASGLPLGMQLIGKPSNDSILLQAGHAFQKNSQWHLRRPVLIKNKPLPTPKMDSYAPKVSNLNSAEILHIEKMAIQAGLVLDEKLMSILLENAPHALSMTRRIRKSRERMEYPSLTFKF